MRATLLFALLACTRAYQLPRSRRALVVPQRRYDLQPRSTPDDEAPTDTVEETPAAPAKAHVDTPGAATTAASAAAIARRRAAVAPAARCLGAASLLGLPPSSSSG